MPPKRLPWIIPEYCEECTSCVAACTPRVLAMRRIDPDTEIAWIDDPDSCTGCGKCADACGLGGIAMTEYVAEARQRFLERF
jgi:Fe-S-cluster-containing hydrogenase component 2